MTDSFLVSEQERTMKALKRRLETWREVLVALLPILLWKELWYPAGLVVATTTLFLLNWYWNLSTFTAISLVCLFVNLLDFTLSMVFSSSQQWTAIKEKQYENICLSLARLQSDVFNHLAYFQDLKNSHPIKFFLGFSAICCVFAWIGSYFNNWFIGYLMVTFLVLYPGAKHNGVIEKIKFPTIFRNSDVEKASKKAE